MKIGSFDNESVGNGKVVVYHFVGGQNGTLLLFEGLKYTMERVAESHGESVLY